MSGAKNQFQLFIPKQLPRAFSMQRCEGVKELRFPPQPSYIAELALSLQAGSSLLLQQWHRPTT